MNGMNKAVVGAVFGIALIYSVLSLMLTVQELLDTGVVTLMLFAPNGDALGIDLAEYLSPITGLYPDLIDTITGLISSDPEMVKNISLALVIVGFVLSAAGMATKPSLEVAGTENPAEYMWTHRPKATAKALGAPWGLLTACYRKHKALVILPIILLPLYIPWSIMMTLAMVIPFAIVKGVTSVRMRSAAKKERKDYESSTHYAVCPKCKRNFERPKIRCKCGLELDYPVPNVYGIKKHTCNNGHPIPCVSGKRSELRTICPYCGSDIETREAIPISIAMVGAVGSGKTTLMLASVKSITQMGRTREAIPISIAMVGAVGSGKTTLMLASVKSITQMGRTRDVSVEAVTPGISKNAVAAKDVVAKSAPGELDSECMFIRSRTLQDREIIFNDISGQEYEAKENKILFEEFFTYSDGIIFTFDPIALKRQGRGATPTEVFESFHYMYTQINGISPSKVNSVPMAVVATKNDVMNPKLKDEDVRQFLIDNGQNGFVKVLESLFSNVRYFAVNSTGDDCVSAAKPVWWIVGESDQELYKAVPIE